MEDREDDEEDDQVTFSILIITTNNHNYIPIYSKPRVNDHLPRATIVLDLELQLL